ncbi:hypothetical protein [Marinobacter alkaliphilus]|uniref:Uncharacterized protein n=1 Tax=Marinobacter alkaliphilus TaxID=254719 RepID=A0ABZ3EAJ6_9GAMM
MKELERFFPSNVLASLLAPYQLPRYQLLVPHDDPGQAQLFLFRRLEEGLLDRAYCLEGEGGITESGLRTVIEDAEPDLLSLGQVSVCDAVSKYNFLPKGFSEVRVSDYGGSVVGRTLSSYYDGVVIRYMARSHRDFCQLINTILAGRSLNKLIESQRGEGSTDVTEIITMHMPSGQQIVAKHVGAEIFNAMVGAEHQVSVIELGERKQSRAPAWASEGLLPVGLIDLWDEEPPSFVIDFMLVENDPGAMHLGAKAHDLYLQKPSLAKILNFWVECSNNVLRDTGRHPGIGDAAGKLLSNPDYDPLICTGYSTPEWYSKKLTSAKVRDKKNYNEAVQQARIAVEASYPELDCLRVATVAWVWNQYIKSTEDPLADTLVDPRFRIDRRPRDPAFLCYVAFKPSVTGRIFADSWSSVAYFSIPTPEGQIEANTKAFYLMLGSVVKYILDGEDVVKSEKIEEACFHIQQVLWGVRGSWALIEAATDYDTGPLVMSPRDIEYCLKNDIPMTAKIY